MQEQEKVHVQPICCCGVDEREEYVIADMEMPGVEKKDIDIRAFEDGFRINAPRQDLFYTGVYHVGCEIDAAKTRATYQNGILHLEIPIKSMPDETKITPT
jgi:HSP20 family molecular chaperone IbpA